MVKDECQQHSIQRDAMHDTEDKPLKLRRERTRVEPSLEPGHDESRH